MQSILKISEAAGLAVHAVMVLARKAEDAPMKISTLADMLNASENHLGKVMHRLTKANVVLSRRGPAGGFVLAPEAKQRTLLDLYELFDGPIDRSSCLLGYDSCPFGGCVLGDALRETAQTMKNTLSRQTIGHLSKTI